MKIHFWGVRGSIATPGADTAEFGGNTSCVSVELDDGRTIICDAGTGIRECGSALMARGGAITATILVSHTHWDHIQGFPFFVPSYVPGNSLHFFGPASDVQQMDIQQIIEMQTRYEVFPVKVGELGSEITYSNTREGPLDTGLDGVTVTACKLGHPVPCYAYRIEADGAVYVYGGDHEPFRNLYRDDPAAAEEMDEELLAELDEEAQAHNHKIADFLRDADVVSWDSMYTREEYETNRRGWGHSWYERNLELAREAGIKHLIFTHHDPTSTDTVLHQREAHFLPQVEGTALQLTFAREGMEIAIGQ